jgi:hypothetical protein
VGGRRRSRGKGEVSGLRIIRKLIGEGWGRGRGMGMETGAQRQRQRQRLMPISASVAVSGSIQRSNLVG